jgi:hypothetical protein
MPFNISGVEDKTVVEKKAGASREPALIDNEDGGAAIAIRFNC